MSRFAQITRIATFLSLTGIVLGGLVTPTNAQEYVDSPRSTKFPGMYCAGGTCECGSVSEPHDFWTATQLTGDWGGERTNLAAHGITYSGSATQFYQGVASGGAEQTFRYGGKVDQYLIFDSEKLGLWEGMKLIMHAETAFGENSIFDAAVLDPVNIAFLNPGPNDHVTAITHFQFEQQLGDGWAATFGRINTIDLWAALYPKYGKGLDGFMNTSMMIALNAVPTLPLVFNGAGVLKAGERGVEAGLLVLDPANIPTISNLDNLFDNGSTVVGLGRIFTDHGGLPGSHMVLGTYATGKYTSLDRSGWSFQPGQGVVAPQSTGSWMAAYVFQQALWMDRCDERRSIELFSNWGFADPETSPYEWTMSVSLEGYGLISGREDDRMGIGYFYSGLSEEFKSLLPALALDDLQGAEIYYNAAVTPWFHLTADLQFVEPAFSRNDTAVVVGLRGKIDI